MTLTTLIGMTDEEIARARDEMHYEVFQLDEITRHYEARMRRRDVKRNIMRKLAFSTSSRDYDLWKRRRSKLDELDKHDERDRKRWYAGMDRCIALTTRWNAMVAELDAAKEKTA